MQRKFNIALMIASLVTALAALVFHDTPDKYLWFSICMLWVNIFSLRAEVNDR